MSKGPASKEQQIKVLYSELNKLGQNGEYEKAIKTANRSKFAIHVAHRVTTSSSIIYHLYLQSWAWIPRRHSRNSASWCPSFRSPSLTKP